MVSPKLRQPGYLLNPGDMFQVIPEKVLIATGAPRQQPPDEEYDPTIFGFAPPSRRDPNAARRPAKAKTEDDADAEADSVTATPAEDASLDPELAEELSADLDAETAAIDDSDPAADTKKQIMALRTQTKTLLTNPPKKLSGGLKQDLRAYSKALKSALSQASSTTATALDELSADFNALSSRASSTPASITPTAPESTSPSTASTKKSLNKQTFITNPLDKTKPYHTPWRPRDFMPVFAFIPRYLEVNQNICSAVYLRHPVAKPGLGELPTPFHPETGQLTFNWYLRRR